jgi:hypothetical protein
MLPAAKISKGKFKSELQLQIAEGQAIQPIVTQSKTSEGLAVIQRGYDQWTLFNENWIKHNLSPFRSTLHSYRDAGYVEAMTFAATATIDARTIQYKISVLSKKLRGKIIFLENMLVTHEFMTFAEESIPAPSLAYLHPTVQQVAGKLYADGHYRQALLDTLLLTTPCSRSRNSPAAAPDSWKRLFRRATRCLKSATVPTSSRDLWPYFGG